MAGVLKRLGSATASGRPLEAPSKVFSALSADFLGGLGGKNHPLKTVRESVIVHHQLEFP